MYTDLIPLIKCMDIKMEMGEGVGGPSTLDGENLAFREESHIFVYSLSNSVRGRGICEYY